MARNFSGASTDRAAWSSGPILYEQTAFSILCWIRRPTITGAATGGNRHFFIQHANFNHFVKLFFRRRSDQGTTGVIVGTVRATTNVNVVSTNTFDDDAWHRVLLIRRSSGNYVELYVDGTSEASSATDPGTDAGTPTDQYWGNNDLEDEGLGGDVARAAFLSGVALTPQQADSFLYTGKWPVGIDQWIEMSGGSPESDWSGNSLNGTLTGTTIADHAPAQFPFGVDVMLPYEVAAVAAGQPMMRRWGGSIWPAPGAQRIGRGW